MLYLRDAGVRDLGAAGGIFFVPEVEVGQVLRSDERDQIRGGGFSRVIAMPEDIRLIVKSEDRDGVDFGGLRWGGL